MNATDAATFWDDTDAARTAHPDPWPNTRLAETVTATGPGGRTAQVIDHVLLVRRTA